MTILVDVDGVLADFCTHVRDVCNVKSEITEMELSLSLTEEEMERVKEEAVKPDFCYSMPAFKGAKEFLAELMAIDDVYAITSPWFSPTWAHERKLWLMDLGLPVSNIISCSAHSKPLVSGRVLIEDHPTTLVRWLNHNSNGRGILRHLYHNRPYSRTMKDAEAHEDFYAFFTRCRRAKSYEEIISMMREIYKL